MHRVAALATSLFAALVAGPAPAVAQDRTATEDRNVAIVERLFDDGWGARPGWEAVWRAHLAPDVRTFFHAFPPTDGRAPAIAFNRDLFAGFPDLHMSIEDVVAEGDTVIVRGRLTGRHDGPFLGIPASGASVDVPDVTLFRLRDEKVIESRYFTDLLAVMTAIGAIPAMR
ncbi:ester cyclase [Jannaschia sp. KMU-145]|uniref:ester cyclase n=1 Tax=Jannaschia halovivens TaxID=3388667 RepID=UPI00396B0EA8